MIICGRKEEAEDLRGRVCSALKRARKPPRSNISRSQREALRNLKKDETIMILPADKGNATVVMKKSEYTEKMSNMLQEPVYKKLRRDPTKGTEEKVTVALRSLLKEHRIGKRRFDQLKPSWSYPPRLYGLPKIHKPDIPLRPIVSSIGSPTYKLAKFLSSIIGPLVGHSDYHVRTTKEFVEYIRQQRIEDDELMVSFDVTSLFTNVPVNEALTIIGQKLEEDEFFEDRMNEGITRTDVVNLLQVCLKSTNFVFQGEFFQQMDGAAMGSPVSPIVANLYMEFFEQLAISTAPTPPRKWKRYVDDTFCIIRKDAAEEFMVHLNSLRPSIQFTMEKEEDRSLAFLDVLLKRKEDGFLETLVYRKSTHTNRYLQYNSHHPTCVKKGLVKCLFNRSREVTIGQSRTDEEDFLFDVLRGNGYSNAFVKKSLTPSRVNQLDPPRDTISIPYVEGLSEDISRICRKFNIRTFFKTVTSIRTLLVHPKDPIQKEKRTRVVYEVPCSCGKVYIGKTIRTLETRIKEHKKACREADYSKSAIAEHAWTEQHQVDWDDVKILDNTEREDLLLLREAAYIKLTDQEQRINRDEGVELPAVWTSTLRLLHPTQRVGTSQNAEQRA